MILLRVYCIQVENPLGTGTTALGRKKMVLVKVHCVQVDVTALIKLYCVQVENRVNFIQAGR
jgi:hypothetical protein